MIIRIGGRPAHGFGEPLALLSDCHRRIELFLQVLADTTHRVAGGALTARERADLEAALQYFATGAVRHTADEEESVFPRLRACGQAADPGVIEAIRHLECDHAEAERRHVLIDALIWTWLADGTLDQDATAELGVHLTALQAIYRDHIAIEDRMLFSAASRLLSFDQLAQIGEEMAARRGLATPSIAPG
jgi:hemerythrin-like domain-containing protein